MEAPVAARAVQGVGAAIVTPLTLTLVSEALTPDSRGAALGIWGAISGLGVMTGPFVGGLIVEGIAWQWIFWLSVPIGLALVPLASRLLSESHGPDRALDLRGLALAGAGLFGVTFGIVRGEALGWTPGGPTGPAPRSAASSRSPTTSSRCVVWTRWLAARSWTSNR